MHAFRLGWNWSKIEARLTQPTIMVLWEEAALSSEIWGSLMEFHLSINTNTMCIISSSLYVMLLLSDSQHIIQLSPNTCSLISSRCSFHHVGFSWELSTYHGHLFCRQTTCKVVTLPCWVAGDRKLWLFLFFSFNIPVKLPWIFPGAPLTFNGARNISGNLTSITQLPNLGLKIIKLS